MNVLGIETSCDETGVAVYHPQQGLLAHRLYSQAHTHQLYGGVVPEIASRDHIRKLIPLVREVIKQAELSPQQIKGIAYTAGPGLAGALMVGAIAARSLAWAWGIPAIAVHHMEGHLLAPMLEQPAPTFPFLALLVSGGHTQLVQVDGIGAYRLLGESLDDAAGEAFDKTAKLLGLGYPGGRALAELARQGNADRFYFPRPMTDRPGLDFSFSGLKTHALNLITHVDRDPQTDADIASGFQAAIVETLYIKCKRALQATGLTQLVVAGGVSANTMLRQRLEQLAAAQRVQVFFPRLEFCTDNGAMIAFAGYQRLAARQHDGLNVAVYPRWPLEKLQPLTAD